MHHPLTGGGKKSPPEWRGQPPTVTGSAGAIIADFAQVCKGVRVIAKYPKYYVRPDGLHETILRINGKRKAFRGKTDREVWEKVKAFDREQAKQEAEKPATFAQIADDWWKEIEPTLAPSSTKSYAPAMQRAVEEFGGRAAASITAREVDAFIRRFAEQYARKTVATQLQVIRQIMRRAEVQGVIQYNPATAVRPPKNLKQTRRMAPEKSQIDLIKRHAKDVPFGLFAALIYYTGCRRGEALGLMGKDIDRKAKLIHIRRSVYYMSNAPHVKLPKTEAGVRDVPLLPALNALLPDRLPAGYLFAEPDGEPLTYKHIETRYDAYRAASGVTVTPHQIRHGYATALFECGVDAKTAQALLGHAQISTTMDIYTHVCSDAISAAAEKMKGGF